MRIIDLEEAKTRLDELLEQAADGEPFVIARSGKPLVKVTAAGDRRIGFMEGEIAVPDDFDRMGESEIETQLGRSP